MHDGFDAFEATKSRNNYKERKNLIKTITSTRARSIHKLRPNLLLEPGKRRPGRQVVPFSQCHSII